MLRKKGWILSALFVLSSMGIVQAQAPDNNAIGNANQTPASGDQQEARRIKYLKGLRKLSSDKELHNADSLFVEKGFSRFDILYLSEDFQKVHHNEFTYLMDFSEYKWTADVYVDSASVIRAKVARLSTKEDKQKALDELRKLIEEKTPQSIERDKIIAGQLGKPAPLFSVTDVDGVKYDLAQLKGKVVVLNFWFIGCAPCKREVPELNKIVEKYSSKDVVFLAFEVNDNSPEKIKALTKGSFNYTQVAGKRDEISVLYKIKTYPTSYVIDQRGIIRFGLAAYNPFKLPEIDATIESLLTKTPGKK